MSNRRQKEAGYIPEKKGNKKVTTDQVGDDVFDKKSKYKYTEEIGRRGSYRFHQLKANMVFEDAQAVTVINNESSPGGVQFIILPRRSSMKQSLEYKEELDGFMSGLLVHELLHAFLVKTRLTSTFELNDCGEHLLISHLEAFVEDLDYVREIYKTKGSK